MNIKEHLLVILAEECAETAAMVSKCLRFGPEEIYDGQPLTNAERLVIEFNDILAVMEELEDLGVIGVIRDQNLINAKKLKLTQYMNYSKQLKTLE